MAEQTTAENRSGAPALIVGDVHLAQSDILPRVETAVRRLDLERIVMLGNYCDAWSSTGIRAPGCILIPGLRMLRDWVGDLRERGVTCEVLVGNHDMEYILGSETAATEPRLAGEARRILADMGARIAAEAEGFLITHAGLTRTYAEVHLGGACNATRARDGLNALFDSGEDEHLSALAARGQQHGPQDPPGPLWTDIEELTADPALGMDQIVGNTPIPTCRRAFCTADSAGRAPRIYLCDTYSLDSMFRPLGDGSMLMIRDDDLAVITSEDLGIEPWL
ncbi:hypothetical protein [Coriobacterium glomerans]|nr:hypothetical protein [Coriobacterium glomerans]